MEEAVPAYVLSAALYARYRSRMRNHVWRQGAVGHALWLWRPRGTEMIRCICCKGCVIITIVHLDCTPTPMKRNLCNPPAAPAAICARI
jgi:hypothetical protein